MMNEIKRKKKLLFVLFDLVSFGYLFYILGFVIVNRYEKDLWICIKKIIDFLIVVVL